MAEVINLNGVPKDEVKADSLVRSLELIDELRANVESGIIVAFYCVNIHADRSTSTTCGNTAEVLELEAQGAVARLNYAALNGHLISSP